MSPFIVSWPCVLCVCICGIVEADQFRDSIKGKWVNNRMKNIRRNIITDTLIVDSSGPNWNGKLILF